MPAKTIDTDIWLLSSAITNLTDKYNTHQTNLDEKFESFYIMLENLEPSKALSSLWHKATQPPFTSLVDLSPTSAYEMFGNQAPHNKRWNQANLGYFDPHLDVSYEIGEIVLLSKKVYFWNVVVFIQQIQNLIFFKRALLVKANITTFL